MMRKTNTSAYYKSIEKPRYSEPVDEPEEEIKEAQIVERVQQSEAKSAAWMLKIRELEAEKTRIEGETAQLREEKDM